MEDIINIILKKGDLQKAMAHIKEVLMSVKQGNVSLDKLTIVKGITKSLDSYEGILPHIELARKLRRRNPQSPPLVGDRISLVIIKGNQMLSKRAEDPKFVKEKGLQIDSDYYINSQLFPPIERILNAVGITKNEILGNGRQVSINDIMNGTKRKMKHEIKLENMEKKQKAKPVLEDWEEFICQKCKKSHRRMPLAGHCECGGSLLFSYQGNMGDRIVKK